MKFASLATVTQLSEFDEVIDVRSPSEFAIDHVPSAVSLPMLDDDERARIGTLYKQVSSFEAKKIGAALVARNIVRELGSDRVVIMDQDSYYKNLEDVPFRDRESAARLETLECEIGLLGFEQPVSAFDLEPGLEIAPACSAGSLDFSVEGFERGNTRRSTSRGRGTLRIGRTGRD